MVPEGHIVSMYSIYSVFCGFKLIFKIKHLKFPAFFESQLKPKHWKHMEKETKVTKSKIAPSILNFFDWTSLEPNFRWICMKSLDLHVYNWNSAKLCETPQKNQAKLSQWNLFKSAIVVTIYNAELTRKTHSATTISIS